MALVGPFELYLDNKKVAEAVGVGIHKTAEHTSIVLGDVTLLDDTLNQWRTENNPRDGVIVQCEASGQEIVRYAFHQARLAEWFEQNDMRDAATEGRGGLRIDLDAASIETVSVAPTIATQSSNSP